MRILGISGSPNRKGNNEKAVQLALAVAQELGRTIAARPAGALRTVKAGMERGRARDLLQAQQVAIDAIGDLFQSEAVREGVTAFLEKH